MDFRAAATCDLGVSTQRALARQATDLFRYRSFVSILSSAGHTAGENPISEVGRSRRAAALVGIGSAFLSVIVFAGGMLAGPSDLVASWGPDGPFLSWPMNLSRNTTTVIAGTAALLGGLGTAAMLWSLRRNQTGVPLRLLLMGGAVGAILLALLPPAGSTDILNYAIYGRIADLGFDPYTMTPNELREVGDPVGLLSPGSWGDQPTVYGPVATRVHAGAAGLGGGSMGWIVFWLKTVHLAAFLSTAVMLDRLAAADRSARTRAAVLWTANPLMLFWMVGSGHADAIAVMLLVGAVYVLRRTSRWWSTASGLAAGVLAGAAISVKVTFALAVFGLALALLRRPAVLVSGAVGGIACAAIAYLSIGESAMASLTKRMADSGDLFLPIPTAITSRPGLYTVTVAMLTLGTAALICWRLHRNIVTAGELDLRPAAAFAIASVILSPVQYPWYDATFLPILALLGATRFDEALTARLAVLSCILLPGIGTSAAQFTGVRIAVPAFLILFAILIAAPMKLRRKNEIPTASNGSH